MCEHQMFTLFMSCVYSVKIARISFEIWVPGLRNFATKFGEGRCETLAQGKPRRKPHLRLTCSVMRRSSIWGNWLVGWLTLRFKSRVDKPMVDGPGAHY